MQIRLMKIGAFISAGSVITLLGIAPKLVLQFFFLFLRALHKLILRGLKVFPLDNTDDFNFFVYVVNAQRFLEKKETSTFHCSM